MYTLTDQEYQQLIDLLANMPIFGVTLGQSVQSANHTQKIIEFINSKKVEEKNA